MRRAHVITLVVLVMVVGIVAAVVISYNSYTEANAVIVRLEDVPEQLVRKSRQTLPDVTFDHARKLPNGNYEIHGKARNGKVREVELNAAGDVVEIE
jgi:hypothetical protein